MNRRRFLKYAGASAAVVGASALELDYVLSPRPGPANQSTVTLNPIRSTSNQNHPPVAALINLKPSTILPTPEYDVEFIPFVYDPDNDPLSYKWFSDDIEFSDKQSPTAKLSEGEHTIKLTVSDGLAESSVKRKLTVEPDQIYPVKPFLPKYKGITYFAGPVLPDWSGIPSPNEEVMDEQLGTIRNDLGCNAIIISGGEQYEDKLIECGRLAIEKGFERIHVQPRYMGATPSQTVEKIGRFASKVRALREVSESVVYCVGHEFSNETAILPGDTWLERFAYMAENPDWPKKVQATLPKMFTDIIAICKQNYGYAISYAAIAVVEGDLIPWENAVFESVGVDAMIQEKYGWTENWIVDLLSHLKQKYRKPVYCMEAGCETFTGSAEVSGTSPLLPTQDRQYDEDEQANWVRRECNALDRAKIDGYFYTMYNDPPGWDTGYGLYNPDTRKRKKGFYMYKSYQPSS